LSSDARTARGFEIDGIKAVAKVFQQQYNAAQDLSRRQALGEIKSVDGQLYEVVSDADRRKALGELGITGVLADPEMYRDTAREEALKAANDWMSKESKSSQMSRDYTGRQVEAMRETAGDRKDLAAALRMANEMRSGSRQYAGESRSNFEFDPERPYVARTVDAVSAPNAPKVAPSMKRTVLDDTTIRAMAGISAADKKERNFVQGTRSEQAAIARQREADQAERDRRLDVARNTRGTTAAEKYLDNQRALLAAVATPTEKQSASTAVARPKVRLSSDQIASIVGAITQ
jgi:hypothetical protein